MANEYYPPLSSLVPADALPEALGFVKDGLDQLLGSLYFKDLQYSVSTNGDSAQYSLTILRNKKIEIEIPGTGIFLELNPPAAAGPFPEFPVTLRYRWGILSVVRKLDLDSFSFDPADFYQLVLTALGITERQLLERAFAAFLPGLAPIDQINDFVGSVNALYGTAVGLPASADPLGEALAAVTTATNLEASVVAFALYVKDIDFSKTEEKLERFFAGLFPGGVKAYFERLLTPHVDATLKIGFGLRFPEHILKPVADQNGVTAPYSSLSFAAGKFSFSTDTGVGYEQTLTATLSPSEIGNTGFGIGFQNAKLDLSRTTNIAEATADGRPNEFVGVFIEEATITLPPYFKQQGASTAKIVGRSLLIGTGGLSGTVSLEAVDKNDPTPALIKGVFGTGFEIGLSAVSVTFKLNAITKSVIRGYMLIPGFEDTTGKPAEVQIEISIGTDGNFSVTASEEQGIRALRIPGVLDLEIDSLTVGRKNGRFFVAVSGLLDFIVAPPLGQFLPDKIDIQKLLIWQDGKIEFEGGKITLPRAVSLKIGPVALSVTALGFGSHEQMFEGELRQYDYFTFDGGVNVDPGGVDVSGSGVAFYYTVDNGGGRQPDRFMRIQSIAVDLVIPGSASRDSAVLLLKGYLSMRAAKPPAMGPEYIGAIAFTLPKLKMSGAASMRLAPRVPAFLIDVGLEISSPILLGSTGLGIWGFRALIGESYVASKTEANVLESEPWWKYYKAKIDPDRMEGIQVSKFAQRRGFSFGAGVSLGTSADVSVTFSSKLFFLLSLPDVFLLQGQAQILKGRILLTDTNDPPFFTLIAITKSSIEAAFGVTYSIPDADGEEPGGIATVNALIELGYFWGNSSSWYVNIGRENPPNERVLVRLLKIIDAYFYFMMSASGIRAGAGASYDLSKKFGPLKAELRAYLDTAGRVSFRPSQIGASMRIGGSVGLSIFGFGFGISVAASLAAEGTKPFTVTGSLEVCVRVLRKDRCARFEFTWIFNPDLDETEIKLLKEENLAESGKALNIHTGDTFELWTGIASMPSMSDLDAHVIPMDSYIDIEFAKGVNPSATVAMAFGGNTMGSASMEYFAPQRGKSDRVRHEYTLESVEILYRDGTIWKPYDIYGAAVPPQLTNYITSNPATLKQGFWQYKEPNVHKNLRILAQTPLTWVSQGSGDTIVEDSGITAESIFCAPEPIAETCTSFDRFETDSSGVVPLIRDRRYFHEQFQFRVTGDGAAVVSVVLAGHNRAVRIEAGSALELYLIEPATRVRLTLRSGTGTAVARFYCRVPVPPVDPLEPPASYTYALVSTKAIPRGLVTELLYDDLQQPVDKVVIEAGPCRVEPPLICSAEVSVAARSLEKFLDTLARRGRLGQWRTDFVTCDYAAWDGIFINSPLYAVPVGDPFVRLDLSWLSDTELRAELSDWRGFRCPLELTLVEGGPALDWSQLITLFDIRPDPENRVPGANRTFLIDGRVTTPKGERRITLRGRSCYTIIECIDPGGGVVTDPITAEAVALGELLGMLATGNRLTQPRLKLDAAEIALFDRMFHPPPSAPGLARKVWFAAEMTSGPAPLPIEGGLPVPEQSAGRMPALQLVFQEGSAGGTVTLTMPHAPAGFTFEAVTGFGPLRAGRQPRSGVNFGFLIDARVRTGAGESTLTASGESPVVVTFGSQPPFPVIDIAADALSPPMGEPLAECALYLAEVCLLDYPSAAFNETLPSQSDVDAEVASIVNAAQGSIQPLWHPYTDYAIRVTATDRLYRDSGPSTLQVYPPQEYVFAFRTAGPLGHFHMYPGSGGTPVEHPRYAALAMEGREDEFRQTGLLHYLDFARCYPNADGQLLSAKPLFYSEPKLLLFYLQTYVARMFCDWAAWGNVEGANARFEVVVKQPAPDPSLPDVAPVAAKWEVSPLPLVSQDVTILNNMIRHGTPCGTVTEITPTFLYSAFPFENVQLEPLKLYTAIFNLGFKKASETDFVIRELLRYPFQTSRYAGFDEQVLDPAVYEIARAFDVNLAASVLADTIPAGDALRQRFGDPFNRLIEGALKLEAIHPAGRAELNVIRDSGSGRILGVLWKSPEPLNDPKIPAADLADTIELSVNGGPSSDYTALHARDRSQAFITNDNLNIPSGATLDFTFRYKLWDGAAYAPADTVAVQVVLA